MRGEIPTYFTDSFWESVLLWRNWRNFGLPNGGGWLHERPEVIQVITIIDEERIMYEQREAEERRNGDSRRATGRNKS